MNDRARVLACNLVSLADVRRDRRRGRALFADRTLQTLVADLEIRVRSAQ